MKIRPPVIAVPALGLVSFNVTTAAIALVVAIGVCAIFCYLLITRTGVAPRLKLGKGKRELGFERLPPRVAATADEGKGSKDQA